MKAINPADKRYDYVWNKLHSEFRFQPSVEQLDNPWISVPFENKKYHLNAHWNEDQERLITNIFKDVVRSAMYALDWRHDGFIFDLNEDIPYEFEYHDDKRNVNVYFPTYYPDGDYFFFISLDWKYGLFGHPWRKEIVIMGEELIEKFDLHVDELGLRKNEGIDNGI